MKRSQQLLEQSPCVATDLEVGSQEIWNLHESPGKTRDRLCRSPDVDRV